MWARNDHAPGARRPAAPWEEWFIPPKPPELIELGEHAERAESAERSRAVAVAAVPASSTFAEPSPPFRPWRIDFTRPDVIEYPAVPDAPVTGSPDSGTVAKRLLLLLGLAYLFIAALTSGLAYTGYLTTTPETNRTITNRTSKNNNTSTTGDTSDTEGSADSAEPPRPPEPRPPSRHPNAPGLHTRPDGSRYLIMPLPADLTDRFRGQAETTAHATRPGHAARPARPARAVRVVPAAAMMGGAL